MKNKKCPYAKSCDKQNDRLDPIWRFDCQQPRPQDCLYFYLFEREKKPLEVSDAVQSS